MLSRPLMVSRRLWGCPMENNKNNKTVVVPTGLLAKIAVTFVHCIAYLTGMDKKMGSPGRSNLILDIRDVIGEISEILRPGSVAEVKAKVWAGESEVPTEEEMRERADWVDNLERTNPAAYEEAMKGANLEIEHDLTEQEDKEGVS